MKKATSILLCIAFSIIYVSGFSQTKKVENLPKYYKEKLNFGFYLGINRADFIIHPVNYIIDTLLGVESTPKSGFNLGIIAEIRLHEYITFRFLPDLAFGERNIQYTFKQGTKSYTIDKKVESTFLDFPLNLKYRTKRLNNFSAYLVGGGRLSLDLASQKEVDTNKPGQEIVRLYKQDYAYEGGTGVEFYLPYFKFGIEAKLIVGVRNLLVKDATIYSQGINQLNSKLFLISFTFEG